MEQYLELSTCLHSVRAHKSAFGAEILITGL